MNVPVILTMSQNFDTISIIDPISTLQGSNVQNVVNTGVTFINTANANLDGTGAMSAVVTGGANGTRISNIRIKATGSTSQGIVRLFLGSIATKRLFREILIPASSPSGITESLELSVPINCFIENGITLFASTENADGFNVIAEGLNWQYASPPSSICCSNIQSTGYTGIVDINTANSNLDGSGAISNAYTTNPSNNGALINSITIKAAVATTQGMIRFFLLNNQTNYLFTEIQVPASTPTSLVASFECTVDLGFYVSLGDSIAVSTENSEDFVITVQGTEWVYV